MGGWSKCLERRRKPPGKDEAEVSPPFGQACFTGPGPPKATSVPSVGAVRQAGTVRLLTKLLRECDFVALGRQSWPAGRVCPLSALLPRADRAAAGGMVVPLHSGPVSVRVPAPGSIAPTGLTAQSLIGDCTRMIPGINGRRRMSRGFASSAGDSRAGSRRRGYRARGGQSEKPGAFECVSPDRRMFPGRTR